MQWVNEIDKHIILKKKAKDVVAIVSGSLKPYFYFVCRAGAGLNPLQESIESIPIVGNGKHIREHFTFRAENKAIMLIFSDINSYANHNDTSMIKNYDAVIHRTLCIVTLFYINRLSGI